MNKARLIWTEHALKDLEFVFDFLYEKSQRSAASTVQSILGKAHLLTKFPKSGPIEPLLKNLKGKYRYLTKGHYKIVYRVEKSSIYIVRIFDTRQDPSKLKL